MLLGFGVRTVRCGIEDLTFFIMSLAADGLVLLQSVRSEFSATDIALPEPLGSGIFF